MSLKTLKLAAAVRAGAIDPMQRGRAKLLSYLSDQKSLAMAEIEGRSFAPARTVRRKNDAGEMVRVEQPRHVRRGWFRGADGNLYFQLRYGSKPLALGKDVNAVAVDEIRNIPDVVDTLVEAVNAGELDQQITAAIEARRAGFAARQNKSSRKS